MFIIETSCFLALPNLEYQLPTCYLPPNVRCPSHPAYGNPQMLDPCSREFVIAADPFQGIVVL